MKRSAVLYLLLAVLVTSLQAATTIKLSPGTWTGYAKGTVTVAVDGTITFVVDPNSEITITGGGGVPPGPVVPPVVPSGTFTETVRLATAAVPAYANKESHRRAMAFGMTFLAQATSNAPVADSRAAVRKYCDAAVGTDKAKWDAWWSSVDAKLNTMSLTPATYTTALNDMAATLTVDLPATEQPTVMNGNPTYGLSPELINFLITVLLPLLLKLLGVQ